MSSSLGIKFFVAVFAYILFEQGRALATGKPPEVPRPIAHLFVLTGEFLRSLDDNLATPSGALATTHPDLEASLAAEIASVRQSPLKLARTQIQDRMKVLAPWSAADAKTVSPEAPLNSPQKAPQELPRATGHQTSLPLDPEVLRGVLREHIKRARALRSSQNPRVAEEP